MKDVYIKRKDILDFDCMRESTLDRIGITKDIISIEDLLGIIEDLYYEIERQDEELRDLKQDIEDNYRPYTKAEQYEG